MGLVTIFLALLITFFTPLANATIVSTHALDDTTTLFTYSNGTKLIVEKTPGLPLVAVDFWVAAGSARENDNNRGAAHFLEHLIFKGDLNQKPGDLDKLTEGYGASLNAVTDKDFAHYYATVNLKYWEPLAKAVVHSVLFPALRQKDMDIERGIVLDEIARDNDILFRKTIHQLFAKAFPQQLYGSLITGTEEDINKLTLSKLKNFHSRWFTGTNLTLVIVGDVDPTAAAKIMESQLESVPKEWFVKDTLITPEEIKIQQPPQVTSKNVTGIGYKAPDAQSPDIPAIDLLLTVLTDENIGQIQNSFRNINDVTAAIKGYYTTSVLPGLFCLIVTSAESESNKREEIIDRVIKNICEKPLTDLELSQAKGRVLGDLLYETEINEGKASRLGFYATIIEPQSTEKYKLLIASLTTKQVQDAAKKLFRPENKIQLVSSHTPLNSSLADQPIGNNYKTPSLSYELPKISLLSSNSAEKTVLLNSFTIITKTESNSEIISLDAIVKVGLAQDPLGKSGLSCVAAHTFLIPRPHTYRDKIQQALQCAGGVINVQWHPDYTEIQITVPTSGELFANAYLSDLLKRPFVDDKSVDQAKKQTIADINRFINQAVYSPAYSQLNKMLYSNHPYQYIDSGKVEEVEKIKTIDVQNFFDKYYIPQNITASAVGAVGTRTVKNLNDLFGIVENEQPKSKPADNIFEQLVQSMPTRIFSESKSNYVLVGFNLPPPSSNDYAAGLVLETLLGEGKSSRLFTKLREEEGIGYEVETMLKPMRGGSQMIAVAQWLPRISKDISSVSKIISDTLTSINSNPPSDEELMRAKNLAIGNYLIKHQRAKERAEWLAFWEAMGAGYEKDEALIENINKVTKEDIIRLAKKYLQNPTVIEAVPKTK